MTPSPRAETRRTRLLAALLPAALLATAFAASAQAHLDPDVAAIQQGWDQAMYATPKASREDALEALSKRAGQVQGAHAQAADALIWEGIVLSSLAGERGGIGALGLVKQARKDFEAAIALDPKALEGSAYTSLGSLYYQVPGWPIGFGDDDKARAMLLKGLEVDPDGIDANYFYGDFLRDQGDYRGAEQALRKALAAPARPGRERADQGRRAEAEAMLAEVRAKLASG